MERVKKTDRNKKQNDDDNRNQKNYKNNMSKYFYGHKAYLYDPVHVLHSTYDGSGLRFKVSNSEVHS